MRYLIFGDTHGNLPAFELMLEKEKGNYDMLLSHGDVVNYGPWSNECVDLLNSYDNRIALMGNHEQYFITGQYEGSHPVAMAFFNFNIAAFNRKVEIMQYQQQHILKSFTVRHTIQDKYVFKDTDISINENYIIGHSHQQYMREINGHYLVNTGSVGQNREFINVINYIMFDSDTEDIELKYLVYDPNIIINEFKARNYPQICIDYYANKKIYSS